MMLQTESSSKERKLWRLVFCENRMLVQEGRQVSFSFTVRGHAGDGLESNSDAEIEAVRTLAKSVQDVAKKNKLVVRVEEWNPTTWSPESGAGVGA